MTRVRLSYGTDCLDCEVDAPASTIVPDYGEPASSEIALVDSALHSPLGTPPLSELARGRRSAIVLIACRTRRTGSQVFLPRIVETLNRAGIPDDRILVYAATGTHANWRQDDAELLAGTDCARRLRFAGHDCRTHLAYVGTTPRGNRILLSREYLDADVKIATGRVTYHYFAGFTGGRKAILPGVAGFDSIVYNHRMASLASPSVGLHPCARNGVLSGNPIHEDMLDAASFAPPDFTLTTVLDPHERIAAAYGGDMQACHTPAVETVRRHDARSVDAPADWMFLSCGGAHCDVNAVQAIKAVINNYEAVRAGGAIIFAAACPEGMAPWLRELGAVSTRAELETRIARGELRHPHNALFLQQVRLRAHVVMVTSLSPQDVRALGFHPAPTLDAACTIARRLAGPPRTSLVVPFGNTTVVRPVAQ